MAPRLGVYSHVSLFKLTHPYVALTGDAITVAFWLAILAGMWFFQRWARLIFVVLLAVALLISPFRAHHYSLSPPPFFVPTVTALMLLLTGAILAMSFLPPVRDRFARKRPNQAPEPAASHSMSSFRSIFHTLFAAMRASARCGSAWSR